MPPYPLKIFKVLGLAFIFCFFSALPAPAEELYLEPVVQGNILEDMVPSIEKGGQVYIDLEALALALQISISYAGGEVQTRFLNQERNFSLNSLPAHTYFLDDGHYFFEKQFLENEFNLRLDINHLDMQLIIDANQELPVVQKLRSQIKRQNMTPYQQHDSFNNYQFDNRDFSPPIADLTLRHNFNVRDYNGENENKKNSTFYQLDTGMLTGGFDFAATIFGDSDNKNYNPRARLTLSRTFLDEPKNALNLVSFEAGDVTGFNSTLFNNSANGRGFYASSFKDLVLSADKTIDISGPLASGWDVELYLNDQLIAFRQAGVNGRYSFTNIPVNYGLNNFKLVFYGPYGEIQTEERKYYSGTSPVKAGEFGYTLNAYQKDHFLFENNEPWINPTNKPTIDFTGYYGINDEMTFISGITQTYNPETFDTANFGTAGIQYIYDGASWQYNTLFDFIHQKTGHHFDVQGDIGIGTIFARYDYYGKMLVPAGYYDGKFMKDLAEVRLSGYLPWMSVPYYISYIERNSMDNEKFREVHTRLSPNFMQHYNLSIENVLSKTTLGNSDYVLAMLQAQYGRLGIHSQVRINISPDSYVQSFNNQIDYRWNKNTYFQFNWDREYRSQYSGLSDLDTFSASAGRIFGFGGLNLSVSYDTDKNASVMLTYNLSFGKVPNENRLFTDAETKMSQRAAIYAKLTDENGRPVSDASLRVSGLQESYKTDKNGGVLISDIEPYQKTVLNVDTESIEDISLVPEFEEKKLVLRPGTVYPLNIKCTRRGGIEGYLSGKPDLFNYKVALISKDGEKTVKTPEQDGSFIFDDMIFGNYVLEVLDKDGQKIYQDNIKFNDAFFTLPQAIRL